MGGICVQDRRGRSMVLRSRCTSSGVGGREMATPFVQSLAARSKFSSKVGFPCGVHRFGTQDTLVDFEQASLCRGPGARTVACVRACVRPPLGHLLLAIYFTVSFLPSRVKK